MFRPDKHITMTVRFLLLTALLLFPSCQGDKTDPVSAGFHRGSELEPAVCPAGQWDIDTRGTYPYPHDCHPFTGEHFTIYSDGSSGLAKQQLAELMEPIFDELVTEFEIEDIEDELYFTGDYTYYVYANKHHDEILAVAYPNGFFIGAIDCVTIPGYYVDNPWWYRCVAQHELTHVFQFGLTGCRSIRSCPRWLDVWFREGQAVHMSGAGPEIRITTLNDFYRWWEDETHLNPISIHRWTDFPDFDRSQEYYPMFGLAYAYLVDPVHGHGATIADMRDLFHLMKERQLFEDAFWEALSISLSSFEDDFYDLMEEYLGNAGQETSRSLDEKMRLYGDKNRRIF
jgi:hypothetical protein